MRVCFHDGGSSASSRATTTCEELDWDGYRRALRRHRAASTGSSRPRATRRTATSSPSRPTSLMLFYLLSRRRAGRAPRPARLRLRRRPHPPHDRLLRAAHRRTARRSAGWCTPGSTPGSTASGPGSSSSTPCAATSTTSRAAPPRRASTSAPWPGTVDLVQRCYTGHRAPPGRAPVQPEHPGRAGLAGLRPALPGPEPAPRLHHRDGPPAHRPGTAGTHQRPVP